MKKLNLLISCMIFAVCEVGYAEDLLTTYHQALEADPELKSSELKIKIGTSQKGQALGEMLPQITGSGYWSTNNQREAGPTSTCRDAICTNNYPGTRYIVSLSQTLIDFPKFWNWQRAKAVESQFSLENIGAQQTLLFNVVEKYFTVLEAEDELSFFKSEQKSTEQQLQQVEKLFDEQLAKITDLYAIEARLDQIKANVIEAEAKVVTAKEDLKELTNTTPVTFLKLRDEIDYKELEGKLEDWLEVAKSENPSLAAQQYAITAADEEVAVQKSKHLPVVELQLNYYNTDIGFQSTNTKQTETQVAAINVNVPIFSGGITTRRTQEAQYKLAINKYANEAKLRALIKETSDAFLSSNANVRRIKATRKALESAGKSREAMETGFLYGVETISDVLNAQQHEFEPSGI